MNSQIVYNNTCRFYNILMLYLRLLLNCCCLFNVAFNLIQLHSTLHTLHFTTNIITEILFDHINLSYSFYFILIQTRHTPSPFLSFTLSTYLHIYLYLYLIFECVFDWFEYVWYFLLLFLFFWVVFVLLQICLLLVGIHLILITILTQFGVIHWG